jgi:hypothetical protein
VQAVATRTAVPQPTATEAAKTAAPTLMPTPAKPPATATLSAALLGLYHAELPAADASSRNLYLALNADGSAALTSEYVGKGRVTAKGTWKADGQALTLSLTEEEGKAIKNEIVFDAPGSELIAKQWDQARYGSAGPGRYKKLSSSEQEAFKLTETLLKNGRFELPEIANLGPFQMPNGNYEKKFGEGATQVNKVVFMSAAFGELNNDGNAQDAAALLWVNTGGSGTFTYMVAFTNKGGAFTQEGSLLVGDRVKVNAMSIKGGQIVLDLLTAGPSDPACCPSQKTTRTYHLQVQDRALKLVAEKRETVVPTAAPPAAATTPLPRYDPQRYACDNIPPFTMTDKTWQVSAPRKAGELKPGDSAEVGLRSKWGNAGEQTEVVAKVIAPDGKTTSAKTTLKAADWAMIYYPKDFAGAAPLVAGSYVVLWEINNGLVACDGFVVAK